MLALSSTACVRTSLSVLQIAVLVSSSWSLHAQETTESQRMADRLSATKDTQQYVEMIRPYLFGNLPEREAAIYRKITFRVSNLEAPWKAASGKEDDGSRYVELDEGAARQIEILAEAMIIEQMQNRDVLIPYLRYVAMAMQRKATFIKSPSTFANVDPDQIDGDPARHKAQVAMTINGMAFLMAHEVGHHILGHYDRPWPTDKAALRQLELDADGWGIQRCLDARPHFSPLGGMLPLLFSYYTTVHPIANEAASDHPAEVRRIEAMFEAMQSALPDFRDEIVKSGMSYRDYSEFIDRMVRDYKRQIENDSTPVESLPGVGSGESDDSESKRHDEDDDPPKKTRRPELGGFCGDIYGRRYCPMISAQPLGKACTCSNLPGWGVVVR